MKLFSTILFAAITCAVFSQVNPKLQAKLDQQAKEMEQKVIEWRRHLHQYPELSNQEIKTAAYITEHLNAIGLKTQTGMAKTGVVALLETGKPGPVIALRADMDGLPVTERNSLPFASKEKATYNGLETGVMHACGHDLHTASLIGTAELLAARYARLLARGTADQTDAQMPDMPERRLIRRNSPPQG